MKALGGAATFRGVCRAFLAVEITLRRSFFLPCMPCYFTDMPNLINRSVLKSNPRPYRRWPWNLGLGKMFFVDRLELRTTNVAKLFWDNKRNPLEINPICDRA